jgi:cell division GTPase FtsZ
MKVALLGVGQAGGKLTEALAVENDRMGYSAVRSALAVNTAEADLQPLRIDTLLVGRDQVKGHGVGGDNERGASVIQSAVDEVLGAVGRNIDSATEAIFLVAGLGGGTGSGGAPVLAHHLSTVYDLPVYALAVLPGRDEGAIYQANAGRSLKTLAREADSVILVDNDAWRESGESLEDGYAGINERIATRVGLLLAAGEPVEGVAPESTVDSSEVINTLRSGKLAALGYASAAASADSAENIPATMSVTRQALRTGTSLPDIDDAAATLLVVAGRPAAIPRRGVERARSWLQEELDTMEVRGGDFPVDSERIAALVLLSGLEGSPRIREFMTRASAAKKEAEAASKERPDSVDSLMSDDLDGLF